MYAGTIEQFIDFLGPFLRKSTELDETVAEMLRWEKTKNKLRTLGPRLAIIPANGTALLVRNPSLIIERFKRTPGFLAAEESASGIFAFYRRSDGTTTISALGELAALILEIALNPISEDDLVTVISAAGDEGARADIRLVVKKMRESHLLARSVRSSGERDRPPAVSTT